MVWYIRQLDLKWKQQLSVTHVFLVGQTSSFEKVVSSQIKKNVLDYNKKRSAPPARRINANANKKTLSITYFRRYRSYKKTPTYHHNTQHLNNKPITDVNNEYKQKDKKNSICLISMSVYLTNWSQSPIFRPSTDDGQKFLLPLQV